MKITAVGDSDHFKIYFDGVLHAYVIRKFLRGISAFHTMVYTVEILLQDTTMTLEYDNRDHWTGVLDAINGIL